MQQQIEPVPATPREELRHDIEEVFGDAEGWLQTPNSYFGGLKPQEFIDRGHSEAIRNLLGMIKQGMFS